MLWRQGAVFVSKRFRNNFSFERELRVIATVSHKNIVHCFGRSCSDSTNCDLFMGFLEEDLGSFLNEGDRIEGYSGSPFSFRDSLDVLLQIAEAMEYLHEKNFVHGDLKPGNILVSKLVMRHSHVPFYLIKIADFGCAQHVDSEPSNFVIGTFKYTAPEVLTYSMNRGVPLNNLQKIDVYTFGILAYQVFSELTTSTLYEYFPDHRERLRRLHTDALEWRPNQTWNRNSGMPELVHLEPYRSTLLPLIERCWASSPEDRPAFPEICSEIQNLYGAFLQIEQ